MPGLAGEADGGPLLLLLLLLASCLAIGVTDHPVILGQPRGGEEAQESLEQVWPSLLPCRALPQPFQVPARLWAEGGSPDH